ncbi:hypothetical protein YC2023_065606 [Brassica napus]
MRIRVEIAREKRESDGNRKGEERSRRISQGRESEAERNGEEDLVRPNKMTRPTETICFLRKPSVITEEILRNQGLGRPRDVRNGSEIFVSCSAISDDLDDPSSNSYSCCGLRLFRAHAFDRGPLVYEPKLGPTVYAPVYTRCKLLHSLGLGSDVHCDIGYTLAYTPVYIGFRP